MKRNFATYLPHVTLSENFVIRPLTQVEYTNKARNGGYFSVCTARLILPIHERDEFDDDPIQSVIFFRSVYVLITSPRNTRFMASEHKGLARKNQRRKGERTTEDDMSYPGFLYPSHIDYDALAPQRGIFKNTLCESVRAAFLRSFAYSPTSSSRSSDTCSRVHRPSASAMERLTSGERVSRTSTRSPSSRQTTSRTLRLWYVQFDIYSVMLTTALQIRHLLSVDGRWSGDDKRRSGHRLHTSLHRLLTLDYEMWEEDVESGELFEDDDHWLNENVFSYYNQYVLTWSDICADIQVDTGWFSGPRKATRRNKLLSFRTTRTRTTTTISMATFARAR